MEHKATYKKGQSSLEFLAMISFSIIFIALFIVLVADMMSERIEDERRERLLTLGYSLQEELLLATTLQEGYEHVIEFSQTIGNFNYSVQSTTDSFILSSGNQTYSFRTPTLSGDFIKGTNTIRYDGTITISQ